MTERDKIAQVVLASGVDLTEDGVGSQEENAYRIADAILGAGRQDPGAPKADELARNAARNALIIPIGSITDGTGITEDSEVIGAIADTVTRNHTVTWERDVNANEVPVRRYVLRGAWEVDPEAARGAAR